MHGWPGELSLVVEVSTKETRDWIKKNIPEWEGLPVVPYTPDDLHTTTVSKFKLRRLYKMLGESNDLNVPLEMLKNMIASCKPGR